MSDAGLIGLGALEAGRRISAGKLTSEALTAACLDHIARLEPQVAAWAHLDPVYALEQARLRDRERVSGMPLGRLHGVPVGLKDIIDTYDFPTENGTVLHAGRQPSRDAALVAKLRAEGAVILGKTVTTELATYAPGKTRNPHDVAHTPGGSSSGSAAAVAANMVPMAVGTQTNGSVIRPASFCGVFGFKPSFGLIPRTGVLTQSPPLDQIGMFARCVEDLALLAEVLIGYDEGDPDTALRPRPPLVSVAIEQPFAPPRLAWAPTGLWEHTDPDARHAFEGLITRLAPVPTVDLPLDIAEALAVHRVIMEADIAGSFRKEYDIGKDRLSGSLCGQIERGRQVSAVDYRLALGRAAEFRSALDSVFDGLDALITPAAAGAAPAGLASTGSPMFCTLWTLCGLPAITLPLLRGAAGLPIGMQLVGRYGDDARLLRIARWLADQIGDNEASTT